MTFVLGLSGGIGTGKSTVSDMFEKLGARIICADVATRTVQAPGSPALKEIAEAFGDDVIRPDGSLDREAVASIVFRDQEARLRLGSIVHPRVGVEMARQLEEARADDVPLAVLDIALLFEGRRSGKGYPHPFDATVLVYAPRDVQIERTMARDGATREDAERRVAAQMPIDEKREIANHMIDNSGSLEATERQVRELYERLVS